MCECVRRVVCAWRSDLACVQVRASVFVRSAVGLVVKYLVANEMPRVRFPDGATLMLFAPHACGKRCRHERSPTLLIRCTTCRLAVCCSTDCVTYCSRGIYSTPTRRCRLLLQGHWCMQWLWRLSPTSLWWSWRSVRRRVSIRTTASTHAIGHRTAHRTQLRLAPLLFNTHRIVVRALACLCCRRLP